MGRRKLLGQYADDIWTMIKFHQESFTAVLQTFNNFYHCTGLKINYDKTEVMRLGSLQGSQAKLYSLLPLYRRILPAGHPFTWQLNVSVKDAKEMDINDPFWQEVFSAWCNINYTCPNNKEEILNQVI